MAKGGHTFMTTDWGVTPQGQNTGISPSLMVTISPKSGWYRSWIPIFSGSPMQTGAPWTRGIRAVISRARSACSGVIGRILTTILPENSP